jgi:glycosyltransferase involved in cell wall biosynthesis
MRTLRVAVVPPPERERASYRNPYHRLLGEALAQHGVETVGASVRPTWFAKEAPRLDAVHFHWTELLISSKGNGLAASAATALKAARLEALLWGLRRSRVRIVWTVHNLRAHEPRSPRLESLLARSTYAAADAVLVHSEYARQKVVDYFGAHRRILVAPIGNYIGAYPDDPRPREEIRRQLALEPRTYSYLLFGQVRRYKRVPQAIEAFRRGADEDSRLLVVGGLAEEDRALGEEVHAAAGADPRVQLRLGFVHADEVASYFRAADAAVLAYEDVFSSAVLLLALSFGLPVIAPVQGSAVEIAPPPAVESFADDLSGAFAAIREGDQAARRDAARRAAEGCSWERMAAVLADAYAGEDDAPN